MNHRRNTSRRPRGSRSERRGRRAKRAAQALTASAAIAAGTQAYAEQLRFDNPAPGDPGRFSWRGPSDTETWLDITKPVFEQTGLPSGPASISQVEYPGFGWLEGYAGTAELGAGGLLDLFLIGVPSPYWWGVPDVEAWRSYAFVYYSGYGSELPQGVPAYIAARFDEGDGWLYGWVGVVRDGTGLEPFAWGYDTVPEPGALALLAFGAALAGSHRRGPERHLK